MHIDGIKRQHAVAGPASDETLFRFAMRVRRYFSFHV